MYMMSSIVDCQLVLHGIIKDVLPIGRICWMHGRMFRAVGSVGSAFALVVRADWSGGLTLGRCLIIKVILARRH